MAWTTPSTWVAAAVLTAAQLNQQIRDNFNAMFPLGAPAWTSYTPVLTQSAAVTKTVVYAKYTQIGKLVEVNVNLTATGAGTANNAITVSLPVTAASSSLVQVVGAGVVAASTATSYVSSICYLASTTTIGFLDGTQVVSVVLGQTGSSFGALANGNVVAASIKYEAA